MTRSRFGILVGVALGLLIATPALAQDKVWHHAVSLIGEPKYPEGFKQFDYVNPDAPKGGVVRLSETGSFDTFNPLLPQGEVAMGLGLVYQSLMDKSLDEPSTSYGTLAEAVSWPDDFATTTFRLNAKAKWQDGEPVTAEDVVWTFKKMVELNPAQANYYASVKDVAVTGERDVTFTFDQPGNREMPSILGQLQVVPKHWWEGKDASGKQRDIAGGSLETPMGSGPYKVKSFAAGRSMVYERDPKYWGADEPGGIGQNNFDEVRYEYFRDLTVEFEAFKGDQFDWWLENQAKRWANSYDFAAVQDGRVVKELFPNDYRDAGVLVGFIPNLRLEKFKDQRVRRAINLAFDFEELNRTIFFGQYERIDSFFFGIPLRWEGLPKGQEREILNSVKDKIPPQVFTEEYKNPMAGNAAKLRGNLREALKLLTEAGYKLDGNRLVNAGGEQLSFEILLNGPTIEPVATSLSTNLAAIGITATIRSVDSPQYINRVRSRDFEMIYSGWGQTLSPGNEQRDFWGSVSAEGEDSRNYAGIADPGVDAMIDKVIYAKDRDTLIASTQALDRVLLAHDYVIPSYTLRNSRVARWDRFSHPDPLPEFSNGFPTVWWWDSAKAAKVGAQ
jgi:microcin C transport system substrate-binding protein